MRYFTRYAYIFLALFGEPFFNCARKSFYLLKRNKERVSRPSKAGKLGIFVIKSTICLSGTALTFALLLFEDFTPNGQRVDRLIAPSWLAAFSFILT